MFSSMSMSLNSLESKTSPHSWHSTNSTSSSRATTRTRRCLQIFSIVVGSEGFLAIGDVWIGFIFGSRRDSPAPLSNSGYFYAEIAACQGIFEYQRLAIRCASRAFRQTFIAVAMNQQLGQWVTLARN